jgi:hypothetical protein
MSGKMVAVLDGHTRTPWTLAFHRLAPHLLVSGCLNGLGILLKTRKVVKRGAQNQQPTLPSDPRWGYLILR